MAYSQEIADRICQWIADGNSLRSLTAKWAPAQSEIYKWLSQNEAFAEQYARAREIQADGEFDEIKTIADEATPENAQVARLRIDARRWRAGKMRPKVYGDKVEHEHAGSVSLTVTGDDAGLV